MFGNLSMSGKLSIKVIHNRDWKYIIKNHLRPLFWWGCIQTYVAKFVSKAFGVMTITQELHGVYIHNGIGYDMGVLSRRSLTTAFVNFLASQFQTDTTEIGDFKYHDSGVGTTAENITDTAMETTDGESRATGTQVASTNTYTSVGTITYTTTKAITEHGLFSSAASTTLMDRSVFAAKNVVNTDALQFTYVLTLNAGG